MCFNNNFENFYEFKSSAEYWGIRDLDYIEKAYIEYILRERKYLYIITELGKTKKIKRLRSIKKILNSNIKFKFITKKIYYSLYRANKDARTLFYELYDEGEYEL